MQLAIAVVYLVEEGNEPLLDLHLSWIARHTTVPYAIYGSIDRLNPSMIGMLEARPEVQTHRFGLTKLRGGPEHSHYLTRLIDRAITDGATHVAIFHVDSFPVRTGWVEHLLDAMQPDKAFAGTLMTELGETDRPRTFCMLVPREFHEAYGPVRSTSELRKSSLEYQAFRAGHAVGDSGDVYGWLAHKHGRSWLPLPRTNAVDDHYAMGGIYGDVAFHLGGAARKWKGFMEVVDGETRGPGRLRRLIRRLLPSRYRVAIPRALRRVADADHTRHSDESAQAYEHIRERLLADPDGYISYLRGV